MLELLKLVIDKHIPVEIGTDSLSMIKRVNSRSGIKSKDAENIRALLALKDAFRSREFDLHFLSESDNLSDALTKFAIGRKLLMLRMIQSSGRLNKTFAKNKASDSETSSKVTYDAQSQGTVENSMSWCEERDDPLWGASKGN